MNKYLLLFFIVLSLSINAADSTLVRVKVDIDSVILNIDEQQYTTDYYGNSLVKDAWFMLMLKPGNYNFIFNKNDSLLSDTTIEIVDQEIITLEYFFFSPISINDFQADLEFPDEKVKLTINSDPDSAYVIINDDSTRQTTPLTIDLPPDSVKVEIYKDNYSNLVSTMMLELNREINANFILRAFSPPGLIPESLGLRYLPIQEMKDTLSLKKVASRYNSMTETFFIFPFLQGLLMKLVVSNKNQNDANIMVVSGAGLTLGTYLLGKIVVKKKYQNIIAWNEQLELDNISALEHNAEVDSIIREKNEENIKNWERENLNRGKVEIYSHDKESKED